MCPRVTAGQFRAADVLTRARYPAGPRPNSLAIQLVSEVLYRSVGMLRPSRISPLLSGQPRGLRPVKAGRGIGPLQHEEAEVPMTALDNRARWWSRAACSTADSELFFPISSAGLAIRQMARAKAICARCEIQQECLDYALDAGPIQGVWGGMTERERRVLKQRGRRARARLARERSADRAPAPQGAT